MNKEGSILIELLVCFGMICYLCLLMLYVMDGFKKEQSLKEKPFEKEVFTYEETGLYID